MRSLLPPKKRDWTKGHMQVGLFLRTESGSTIEVSVKIADRKVRAAAVELLRLMSGGSDPEADRG